MSADDCSDGKAGDGGSCGNDGFSQIDADTDSDAEEIQETLEFELEDVVVSATRTPTKLSNISVPAAVVDQDTIEKQGARDAGEAAENIAGVFVSDYEPAGRGGPGTSLYIHGLPPDRILVMIDNQRVPWTMRAADMELVPAQLIKRLEVTKGPSSSLYGSDAVGGTAHILTRSPTSKPVLEADIWGGSHDTFGVNVLHSWKAGPVGWVLNFNREQSDGWMDKRNQQLIIDLSEGGVSDSQVLVPWVRENPYTTNDLFGKIEYEATDNITLFASTRYHFEDSSKSDTDRYEYKDNKKRLAMQAGGRYEADRFRLSLQGNWFRRDQKTRSNLVTHMRNPIPPPEMISGEVFQKTDTIGNDYSVELVSTVIPADWTILTAGLVYRHDNLEYKALEQSSTIDEEQDYEAWQTGYGAFLQGEIFLFDGIWSIVPGIRVDYHTKWGAQVNPKLSTLVRITDSTALRAGVGRAFRAPILSQMYRPVFQHVGYYIVGNPKLKPEKAYAWNAEVEQKFNDTVKITAGYFQYEVLDMIASVVPDDLLLGGMSVMTYDNLKRARIIGGEGQVMVTLSDLFRASVNYTYTRTRVLKLDSNFKIGESDDPDTLGTVPEHNAGIQLFFDYRPWGIGGYIGASYQSSFEFVGMGGRWYRSDHRVGTDARIYKKLGEQVELSIRASNWLFYKWDRDGDGDSDMPPLSVYGQLRVTL